MSAFIFAAVALAGFACTNALETAILSLSYSEEKKLIKALRARFPAVSVLFGNALEVWRKHPTAILMGLSLIHI